VLEGSTCSSAAAAAGVAGAAPHVRLDQAPRAAVLELEHLAVHHALKVVHQRALAAHEGLGRGGLGGKVRWAEEGGVERGGGGGDDGLHGLQSRMNGVGEEGGGEEEEEKKRREI
jgi:hypothetical protein